LPISSSGHTTLIPWLLGSEYPRLDADLRKALEVALHAGALAALLADLRPSELDHRELLLIGIGTAPAGLAGVLLERRIEDRLGTPAMIAAGLLGGGVALALADRRPQARREADAGVPDALWLGLAQAGALAPGVSRNGATLAMARFLRFRRPDANRLSRRLALPVITGATMLKAWRVRERPELADNRLELAAGALASFVSTRLAGRLIGRRRDEWTLAGYGVYRVSLGAWALVRLRRTATLNRRQVG
jgi:undecaprenyl-diphosphatase